jgi:DNA helicase IV
MSRTKMMTLGDFENLSTVFRYHIEIAKLANNFTERDLPSMVREGNGVKPKIVDVTEEQLFPEIAEILRNLVLRRKRVGVISPDKDKLKALQAYLKNNNVESIYYEENRDFREHDFSTTVPLLLSSFSAKGLEFENVIVFGFNKYNSRIEKLMAENLLKEIIFVSITRCNSDLFIVRTPNEVDQIKNLAVEQGVETTDDDLSNLFDDLF